MSDGNPHVIRLTREELYEQVWKTPMRLLARSYGISDVGLAKVCKRYKIPRPSLGYWAKEQVGKALEDHGCLPSTIACLRALSSWRAPDAILLSRGSSSTRRLQTWSRRKPGNESLSPITCAHHIDSLPPRGVVSAKA